MSTLADVALPPSELGGSLGVLVEQLNGQGSLLPA